MDITVEELKNRLDAGDKFVFIDVREPHEFAEFNLNAQLIPLGTLPDNVASLEAYRADEIIIHCRSGARSGQAKAYLQSLGFTNVRNVLGGVVDWQAKFGR